MASMYSHEPVRLERDQENKSNSTESGSVSRKREASIDLESPEKRYRHSCKTTDTSEPSYVLFEEVSARGRKRKASAEREIPKRYRTSTSSSTSSNTSTSSSSSSSSSSSPSSSSSSSSPSSCCSRCCYCSSSSSSTSSCCSRCSRCSSSSSSTSTSSSSSSSTSSCCSRCCYCSSSSSSSSSTSTSSTSSSSTSSSPSSSSTSSSPSSSPSSRRTSTSASSSTSGSKRKEVSAEDVQELLTRKRKASACEETPRKRQKSSELNQSSCSSSSSSSQGKSANTIPEVKTSRADFEESYMQFHQIGEDVCGSVYAGFRLTDYLPVAIKYIQGRHVAYEMNVHKIPVEVALLHKVAGGPESVGKFAAVTLLDWYYLDQQLILVMERPVPSVDFKEYLDSRGGTIKEREAKILLRQLVDATVEMHRKGVFHRDIKSENILIEDGDIVPRVRIMNFGCACFVQERFHHTFSGSLACAPPEWYVYGKYKAGPTTVWQLGALLYRSLHGFKNSTMGILCGKMQLSRNSATQLSRDCLDFLKVCLKKNPKERATLQQLQLHPWFK